MTTLLRVRHGHDHHRVTFVELFFDLVFVFAVTQLSHMLLAHLTPLGVLESAILLSAVWTLWIYTAWGTNWLDPQQTPVRLLLFAVMLGGLVMSTSIPKAFGDRGLIFAVALAVIHLGRTLVLVYALRDQPSQFRNFQRILAWLFVSAALWIAGGIAEGEYRIGLWLAATAVEYLGPVNRFYVPGLGRSSIEDWNIEGGHMAERCGLFIIIALGESILVTGATFAEMAWTAPVVAAFLSSFVSSVAMWWIYFNATAAAGSRIIAAANDPGRLARSAYTYMHIPIVAGIIVTAVADELVLVHPEGHATTAAVLAILVGPALYLAGTALFKFTVLRRVAAPVIGAVALLALLFVLLRDGSPLVLSLATTAILVLMAGWDALAHRGDAAEADHAA
jgi:low temperature requirement protein LtrA